MVEVQAFRRYPLVAVGLLILIAALALSILGLGTVGSIIAGGFAAVAGLRTFIKMVREMARGHWGLDVLAVAAIAATLAVGEEIAAVIIVLMLTGGGALEDFAGRRAQRELTALLD